MKVGPRLKKPKFFLRYLLILLFPVLVVFLFSFLIFKFAFAQEPTSFNPTYTNSLSNSNASEPVDITESISIPLPDLMFSTLETVTPAGFFVASDADIFDGAVVGSLSLSLTLGLFNSPCTFSASPTIPLYEATTNTSILIPTYDSISGGVRPVADRAIGGGSGNGITDGIEFYPQFLTTLAPGTHLSRFFGSAEIFGQPYFVNILVTQQADGSFKLQLIINDPVTPVPPQFVGLFGITDFCTPYSHILTINGVTQDNAVIPGDESGQILRKNPETGGDYTFKANLTSNRDADGDGLENSLDTCPFSPNTDASPRGPVEPFPQPELIQSDPFPVPNTQDPDGWIDMKLFGPTGISGSDPTDLPIPEGVDSSCDTDPASPAGPGALDDFILQDVDNDGFLNRIDNCPLNSNSDQIDTDHDGDGDTCDSTPNDPDGDQLTAIQNVEHTIEAPPPPGTDPCPETASIEELESKIQELNQQIADLEGQITEKQSQLEPFEQLEQAQNDLLVLEQEKVRILERQREIQRELARLARKGPNKTAEDEQRIEDLQQEKETNQDRLSGGDTPDDNTDGLYHEIVQKRADVEQLQAATRRLDRATIEAELNQLQNQLDQLKATLSRCSSRLITAVNAKVREIFANLFAYKSQISGENIPPQDLEILRNIAAELKQIKTEHTAIFEGGITDNIQDVAPAFAEWVSNFIHDEDKPDNPETQEDESKIDESDNNFAIEEEDIGELEHIDGLKGIKANAIVINKNGVSGEITIVPLNQTQFDAFKIATGIQEDLAGLATSPRNIYIQIPYGEIYKLKGILIHELTHTAQFTSPYLQGLRGGSDPCKEVMPRLNDTILLDTLLDKVEREKATAKELLSKVVDPNQVDNHTLIRQFDALIGNIREEFNQRQNFLLTAVRNCLSDPNFQTFSQEYKDRYVLRFEDSIRNILGDQFDQVKDLFKEAKKKDEGNPPGG